MFHQRVFSDWIWRISKFPLWLQILDIYRQPLLMYLTEEEIPGNEKWIEEFQEEYNDASAVYIKSDGQEISTIEWQELKNRFPSFFVHK